MPEASPQNPYESCIVQASAGSGKTYQLSRRFLALVAAGAAPGSILTITFTVKAVAEMRKRIIEDAVALLHDASRREEFDTAQQSFFQEARSRHPDALLPFPLDACATASAILANTQGLRICTIDALFKDWVSKFAWEASSGGADFDPAPTTRLVDADASFKLNDEAWKRLFSGPSRDTMLEALHHLRTLQPDKGVLGLEPMIAELFKHHTFLWQLQQRTGSSLYLHPDRAHTPLPENEAELLHGLRPYLLELGLHTGREELCTQAIATGTISALIGTKLLTQELTVSRILLRGAKRERAAATIAIVEEELRSFIDRRRISALNARAKHHFTLYNEWLRKREGIKKQNGALEFHDLALGCYRLFTGDSGKGATWLILRSIQHLLIDEFQDTSLLQWSIFRNLAEELLAGVGVHADRALPPTVFLVGDAKQSIYGFREAAPEVLQHGTNLFATFGKGEIGLHRSYRTAQVVLDTINAVFRNHIDSDFPLHHTATDAQGTPVIPNCGRILAHEVFRADADEELSALEREAEFVAGTLQQVLHEGAHYPVYDSKTRSFRSFRAKDCIILFRNSVHIPVFEKYLRQAGVPYRREEKRGFFSCSETIDMVALMRFFTNPTDLPALLTVLRSPLLNCDDGCVHSSLESTQTITAPRRWSVLLQRLADLVLPEQSRRIGVLRAIALKAYGSTPSQVLWEALTEFDAFTAYRRAYSGPEGGIAEQNLAKFMELCLQIEGEGLTTFPAYCERLLQRAARDNIGSAVGESDTITIMTIHKAKGLEAPFVCVVECAEPWYREDRYWVKHPEAGIGFIGTAGDQPRANAEFNELLQQHRSALYAETTRLLYVALTRARQYLLVTGHEVRGPSTPNFLEFVLQSLPASHLGSPLHLAEALDGAAGECHTTRASIDTAAMAIPPASRPQRSVPAELDLVFPHRTRSKATWGRLPQQLVDFPLLPAKISASLGSYIHKGLEYAARGEAFPASVWWTNLLAGPFHAHGISTRDAQNLRTAADSELAASVTAPSWQEIVRTARSINPEQRLVSRDGDELVVGCCDLVVVHDNGDITAIEYKTGWTQPAQHAGQLSHYVSALRHIHPSAAVRGLIWSTKTQMFVASGLTSGSDTNPGAT